MHTAFATAAGQGVSNEDYAAGGPDWAFVLDGATAPKGIESGCIHDVPWLVRTLGRSLTAGLMTPERAALPDLVAQAIEETCWAHKDTCDLENPDSPSSTIAIACEFGGTLGLLALADSPIVVREKSGGLVLVEDDRTSHLPGGRPYTIELVRSMRNQPGGFWVASTVPDAAKNAITEQVDLDSISEVGLFSDGVGRLNEWYGYEWPAVLDLGIDSPGRLIACVREEEKANGVPYGKLHDDATAVIVKYA